MTNELVDDDEISADGGDGVASAGAVVPSIPDSARTDVPPQEDASNLLVNTPPDPQGDHTRWMDKLKLTFAVWVVIGSFAVVVGLSITQFVTQKDLESASLDSAIDWAKSIATIALGFALAKSFEESRSDAN
jgi:hypothetical protein